MTNAPDTFTEWPLHPALLAGLAEMGLTTPTAVQAQSYPAVLGGRDLLVQSRTGTGKTFAFGLPILQRLAEGIPGNGPAAIVVLPTRELATQVAVALGKLARPLNIGVAAIVGGGHYRDQLRLLKNGARIVVGTPGRLVDHIVRGSLDLSACNTLVLDEADEILDMGFADELDQILAALPTERQSLLFSATQPPGTRVLANKTLRNPHLIAVSTGLAAAPEITHVAYECFQEHKTDALVNVLHAESVSLAIVFCHTKVETEQLSDRLREEGFKAGFLNGDLAQEQRTRILGAFRGGQLDVLVATDVAARGIDVKGVSHVFNLGVPRDPETYIHRVGRTGRAGASGTAATFVPPRDASRFRRMLQNAGIKIEIKPLPQPSEVRTRLRESYHTAVMARISAGGDPELRTLAGELLAGVDPMDLVTALLQGDDAARAILAAGIDLPMPRRADPKPFASRTNDVQAPGRIFDRAPRADRPDRPARADNRPGRAQTPSWPADNAPAAGGDDAGRFDRERPGRKLSEHNEPGFTRIWLNQGKADHLTPGKLVQMVCSSMGVKGDTVGAIAIHPYFSFFDIQDAQAPRAVETLNGMSAKNRKVKANIVPPVVTPPQGADGPGADDA